MTISVLNLRRMNLFPLERHRFVSFESEDSRNRTMCFTVMSVVCSNKGDSLITRQLFVIRDSQGRNQISIHVLKLNGPYIYI